MLVAGKEASTLSTLLGIVNCAKNGTTRKIVLSNRYQRLAAVSLINTFGQVLFTENFVHSILETKNQLWKLI